jgi:hypothetical protein
MSLALGVLLGVAASLPLRSHAEPAAAEAFVSPQGRFAVAFPAEPVGERAGRETWAGRMEEGSYEVEGAGLRLRVEFHDVPRMATLVLAAGAILDLAKQGVLDDMKARSASVERASLHGHPGLALRYEPGARPGSIEEARLFLVGERLYVAFARADAPGEAHEIASHFLASFDAWEAGEAVAWLGGSAGAGM